MTKADFLLWLERYRYVENIRNVVEGRAWSDEELDRLKDRLEKGGRLEMKSGYKRWMAAQW